ncbi:MAG: formate dehydrogenase accessory sulfurtransferase FdhD [Bacteroidota bacterium]
MISKSTISRDIWTISEQGTEKRPDYLAVEEPLEIQLRFGPVKARRQQSLSITMRTPGHDVDLAMGFLLTEGIIQSIQQIKKAAHLPLSGENVIQVSLQPEVKVDLQRLERHFYTSSSCGICGKSSMAAVKVHIPQSLPPQHPKIDQQLIHQLPSRLRQQQAVFADTGGLHAAALFDTQGQLQLLREDVGRHNAVDKLIGAAAAQTPFPFAQSIILVSGRVSFELVQKSLIAGLPILVAVGAPSSLAIELAQEWKMTIIGFARDGRFNVYCGYERIGLT